MATLLPRYLDKECFHVVEGGVQETITLLEEGLNTWRKNLTRKFRFLLNRQDNLYYPLKTPIFILIVTAKY